MGYREGEQRHKRASRDSKRKLKTMTEGITPVSNPETKWKKKKTKITKNNEHLIINETKAQP